MPSVVVAGWRWLVVPAVKKKRRTEYGLLEGLEECGQVGAGEVGDLVEQVLDVLAHGGIGLRKLSGKQSKHLPEDALVVSRLLLAL